MDIIHNNPFRIAGIFSSATAKELQKNKAKLSAYSKVGREIKFDTDFSILNPADRDFSLAESAFSKIQHGKDRVGNALFWFSEGNTFDRTALSYLKEGDEEKALEIWSKVTDCKEVNSKNYSSFNNIGTLRLLSEDLKEIQEGIEIKTRLIESAHFKEFIILVADNTYKSNTEDQIALFIDEVLSQIKNKYSPAESLDLFSRCNSSTRRYLLKKFAQDPIHHIETNISNAKNKKAKDKGKAFEIGFKLYTDTKGELGKLKGIVGESDLQYKMLADNLAKEILRCAIDHFNYWKESKDPSQDSLKLLNYAKSIVVGNQTRDRIKENIKGITDWAETAPIKEDLDFITNKLKSFQDEINTVPNAQRFLNHCRNRLQNIAAVVGVGDEFYLNVSSAVVSNVLGTLIAVVNEEQDSFTNSSIYYRSIDNLKTAVKSAAKVTRDMEEMDMNPQVRSHFAQNKNSLINLEKQIFNATATSTEKIGRATGTAANAAAKASRAAGKAAGTFMDEMKAKNNSGNSGGCYIATMAYGDYDHPQVLKLRSFRDNVLERSILGRWFIKLYYKYSPCLVNKLKDRKPVNNAIQSLLDLIIRCLKY